MNGLRLFVAVTVSIAGLSSPALAQTTGTIGGTITDASNGQPLASGGSTIYSVLAATADGSTRAGANTDSSGHYSLQIAPGTYYLTATSGTHAYVQQLYGLGACVAAACRPADGTPVTIAAGATVTI